LTGRVEEFERRTPVSAMARAALENALPACWIDAVFAAHRQQQYARELLFSTVVDLMTLVCLGLRPSLHAAARQMTDLPVSLASLYDKVNHTEPAILRALVRGGAEQLAPVMAAVAAGVGSLPGWCTQLAKAMVRCLTLIAAALRQCTTADSRPATTYRRGAASCRVVARRAAPFAGHA
jgi:hypothetical protein